MHHEFAACVYGIVAMLFMTVREISDPFKSEPFEWGIYMTTLGFVMLYELLRTMYTFDDVYMYMCMQWTTYLLCGGTKYPYWMAAYGAYVTTLSVIRRAEKRLAEFEDSATTHELFAANAHNTSTGPISLVHMTPTQMKQAQTLHEFRYLRMQGEEPVGLTSDDKKLWKMSDNTGMLYERETRYWIISTPFMSTLFLYVVWWNTYTWYIAVDACMVLALLSNNCKLRFIVYHICFLFALLYGRSDKFNALL